MLPHSWCVTPTEAIEIQQKLRSNVIREDDFGKINYVAGVDVNYHHNDQITQAAVAVLSFPDLGLQESSIIQLPTNFPYTPGLFSFREIPPVLEALKQLKITPDLILCDGQGLAHPRRFGFACHLGVLTNIPCIGVAKTRYLGEHQPLDNERGSWQPLIDGGEIIGAVLRTRTGVKPVYISIGHKISLTTAIDYVLRCTPKYRLPETTRWADQLAATKKLTQIKVRC